MLVLAIGLLIARSIYLNSVPPAVSCLVMPPPPHSTPWFTSSRIGLRVVLAVGLVVAIGALITGPSRTAIRTRSAIGSGLDWIRHFSDRTGVSGGPVGRWTYAHRKGLRIGAVALAALIFVFLGQPTAVSVIVIVVVLLVVLALIELIGRPPARAEIVNAP